MTVEEIRAQVEAGKRQARERLNRDMGAGTYERIEAYSKSDANRAALDDICRACERAGI